MDSMVKNCPRTEQNVSKSSASARFVPVVGITTQDRVIAFIPESAQNTANAIPGIYTVYEQMLMW